MIAHFVEYGVSVEEGPIERAGTRGGIMPVYFHGPDRNLFEGITYMSSDAAGLIMALVSAGDRDADPLR